MAFDVAGARKEGYSDLEIAEFLGSQSKFDVAGAIKEGYSPAEIIQHLDYKPPEPKGFFSQLMDDVGDGMNRIRDEMTGVPRTTSVLDNPAAVQRAREASPMPAGLDVDPGANKWARDHSKSPESVMYNRANFDDQREKALAEYDRGAANRKAVSDANRKKLKDAAAVEDYGVTDFAKDSAKSWTKGLIGLGQAGIGLGNLAMGGLPGEFVQNFLGVDLEGTKNEISKSMSATARSQAADVQEAQGFYNTLKELSVNPLELANSLTESLPGTLAAGGAGGYLSRKIAARAAVEAQGLNLTGLAASDFIRNKVEAQIGKIAFAASAAEGAQSAGQIAEMAQAQGRDWNDYVLPALTAGLGTTAIGIVSNKVGKRFGIGDIETDIAMRAGGAGTNLTKGQAVAAIGKEMLKEGALEELPQSVQEQINQNLALGKPWYEGMGAAGAQGLLAGMAMGGGHSAVGKIAGDPYGGTPAGQLARELDNNIAQFNIGGAAEEARVRLDAQNYDPRILRPELQQRPTAPRVQDMPTTPQAPVVPRAPAAQATGGLEAILQREGLVGTAAPEVQQPAQSAAAADEGAGVSQPTQAAAPTVDLPRAASAQGAPTVKFDESVAPKAPQQEAPTANAVTKGDVLPRAEDPRERLANEIRQIKERAAGQPAPEAPAMEVRDNPGVRPLSVERGIQIMQGAKDRALLPQERGYLDALKGEIGDQAFDLIKRHAEQPYRTSMAERKFDLPKLVEQNNAAMAAWDKANTDAANQPTATPAKQLKGVSYSAWMPVEHKGQGYGNTATASTGLDQRAQPAGSSQGAADQRGTRVPVAETSNGQPGVPGRAFALRGNETTGDATPRSQPLKLAKTAPVNALNWFKKVFDGEFKTDVSPYTGPLTPRQQAASAIAALQGKTLTFLSDKTGNNRQFANGVAMGLGGKHIAINADSTDDSPLLVAMHEVFHTLPVDLRSRFANALVRQMREEGTYDAGAADFLQKFDYEAKDVGEELPAFVVQLIGKRQSFWEGLRDKLGDGDFKSVVQHLLKGLRAYVFGVKDAYGDAFAKKYLGDLSKLEDILQDILIENNWEAEGSGQIATQTQEEPEAVFARRTSKTERIGEFDVTPAKDGTLFVHGDPAAIRAKMPEGVVGRATSDGVAFTNADAPRVRGALSGSNTAYSRAGQVVDKLPMRNGKYLGAPEKFDTPAKIPHLRKWLRQLAEEGAPGRFWYENSSAAILQMTGGDVQEARRFVALLAIYSPQAKVDANSTFALRAWSQYKMGQPISVKTGVMDSKAQRAMDDVDEFWSGEKTGNFFTNLLSEIDPNLKGKQGATIDMWMMRAGQYSSDAPTKTQYAFMENETNRLAQELGWDPHQVQAAIWVAMKARMENAGVKKATEAKSEKRGWLRYDYPEKNGRPVKTRVILDAQAHRDNWLAHSFAHDPTKDDTQAAKFDFSDGVRRHIGQVSWEARPGRSTGVLPGVNDAPFDQQVEFQQAVQKALAGPDGEDLLAQKLGLLVDGGDILAPGVWQGEVAAGMQKQVAMAPAKGDDGKTSLDATQKQALDVYTSVLGLLLRQEGVGWHRPFYGGSKAKANGVELRTGKPFTPEQAKELWQALDKGMREEGVADWEQGAGMISSPQGMRVVNLGAVEDNKVFQRLVESAANGLSFETDFGVFSSDGNLVMNDWKENPNGDSYKSGIAAAGRSDLLGWAGSVLAPRVQRVFEDFSDRYGWGDPGKPVFSLKSSAGGQSGGRSAGRSDATGALETPERAAAQGLTRLPGAPTNFTGPIQHLVSVAETYAKSQGITLRRQAEYVQVDPARAKRIADAYEAMPHAPQDPKVKEAYSNLVQQTRAQYDALAKAGYKFWFMDMSRQDNQSYADSPWNAMRDLRDNREMGVFPTADGFGSTDLDVSGNPLLQDTGLRWPVGGPGESATAPVLANDLFRAVHDAFGHGLEGAGFRAQGEENAWQAHRRLFTGSAVAAITTETRGQNSWLNYGPYGESNRTAKVEDTHFADQKTGLLPEWTWKEGVVGDMPAYSRKAQDTRDLDQDITLEIPVEGGGTAKLTVNAKTYLEQLDRRQEALEMVKECML